MVRTFLQPSRKPLFRWIASSLMACSTFASEARSQDLLAPPPRMPVAVPAAPLVKDPVPPSPGLPSVPVSASQIRSALDQNAAPSRIEALNTAAPVDPALKAAIIDVLNERDAQKKREDEQKKQAAAAEGYEVGSNRSLSAVWDEKGTLRFISPNKDFNIHLGALAQFDSVWWNQPQKLKSPSNVGVDKLVDGSDFRRVRIKADGTMWDNIEFNFVTALEGLNIGFYDHMWVGFKDVPFFGSIQLGQHKIWQSMESIARNEDMAMMERSSLFDTFIQEFGLGIFQTRAFFDERLTASSSFHRTSIFNGVADGAMYANGQYATSERITGLPIYEEDGRYLLHLGASYHWRQANQDSSVTTPLTGGLPNGVAPNIVRFQSRADLRDAVGVGSPAYTVGQRALQGNNNRFIDTGNILADSVGTFATELYGVYGPFSFLTESTFASVNNAYFPASNKGKSVGDQFFWGTNGQASYFLTGESRGYNKRYGYYDRVIPYGNAFFVKGENGIERGIGAWELTYRFTYTDLNSPNATNAIRGGQLYSNTVGVNWHLNPNMRIMLNYTTANRIVDAPNQSGLVQGIGTRIHVEF